MKVLIVDDDVDLLQELTYSLDDLDVESMACSSGEQALNELQANAAAYGLVLTDVRMPGFSGLELLQKCRDITDLPPVAIMSGHADMEMIIQALRLRAMDFLVKPFGVAALRELVQRARSMQSVRSGSGHARLPLRHERWQIELDTQVDAVSAMCAQMMAVLQPHLPNTDRDSVRLALTEALNNAVIHGNLGLSSELKESGDWEGFEQELKRRQALPELAAKAINISLETRPQEICIVIEDEGAGFDLSCLADPTDPSALLNSSGRGVMLMRFAMDEVSWNSKGNRVTMRKRWSR